MTAPNAEERAAEPLPVIDARGMKCPWPVLRAARSMRDHAAFRLLADDPVALRDVPELAAQRGWSCVVEGDGPVHGFRLVSQGS